MFPMVNVALAGKTYNVLADTDITISRDIETGLKAQGNVRAAGYLWSAHGHRRPC